MFNLFTADLQRIFRGKAVYIIGLLIFIFPILHKVQGSSGGPVFAPIDGLTGGYFSTFHLMFLVENMLFLVPLILSMVIGDDYKAGTMKNIIGSGFSRSKYYLSKLFVAWFIKMLYFSIQVFGAMIFSTIVHGFGQTFTMDVLVNILRPFGIIALVYLAILAIAMFIFNLFKNENIFSIVFITIFFAPNLIIMMLSTRVAWLTRLTDFELIRNIRMIIPYNTLYVGNYSFVTLLALGFILASGMIGLVFFQKGEVK
ncbi:MAG: ABC transporter permease [Streptococcaceae bacterium]|jgi:ABC-2 type transport system permease protein|nr:ABC transporter permease [Streptococcaceae bacterium]